MRGLCTALTLFVLVAACGDESLHAVRAGKRSATPPETVTAPGDGTPDVNSDGGDSDGADEVPPPQLPPPPTCLPGTTPNPFATAFCACEEVSLGGGLQVTSGDATALGVNGSFAARGAFDLASSLVVGGGVRLGGGASVEGSLRVNDALHADGAVVVRDDLAVGGDLTVPAAAIGGQLAVAGAITSTGEVAAQQRSNYPGDAAPPCACGVQALDVAARVQLGATNNDNMRVGLYTQLATGIVRLGTGRYHVTAAQLLAATFYIEGDVELDVSGLLTSEWGNHLVVEDAGRLTLMLERGTSWLGHITVVSEDPSALRVFIGANETMRLGGGLTLRGSLYAPAVRFEMAGAVELTGALYVGGLDAGGGVQVGVPSPTCSP